MFGPHFLADGSVEFRVWAPACRSLTLCLGGACGEAADVDIPMVGRAGGWFVANAAATAGDRYSLRLPDGRLRPDPASRFQPEGVHGCSQLWDVAKLRGEDPTAAHPRHVDRLAGSDLWRGIDRNELILYELHVGTFTAAGTYPAAIDRLDELADLGVTALELMPLAECAGVRNWGYDGVDLFAPQHNYGTPLDLVGFVDAAHGRGMAVILDVVYNHFGPEGNYLGDFGGYLSAGHDTPWGAAPNFDEPDRDFCRSFILENVRYWIEDYGFDGLRIDATHQIADASTPHIVREIGQRMGDLRRSLGRKLHLIAESNVYDPELLTALDADAESGCGFDALWCDDFIHSVYAVLQPGEHMSARQYRAQHDLDLVLRRGYVFHGRRNNAARQRHGLEEYPDAVGMDSLVVAIQNHDFVGNHPRGRRLHQIAGKDAQRAAAALLLLSPSLPMLFMGEEFASESPFHFFVDFGDADLRRAVEQGRREEHAQHAWTGGEACVSPLSVEAFVKSKIGSARSGDRDMRQWYRQLINLRKQWQRSGVLDARNFSAHWDLENSCAQLSYEDPTGSDAHFVMVRLHGRDETHPALPLRCAVRGDIELSAHCDASHAVDGECFFSCNAFGVVAGRGALVTNSVSAGLEAAPQ